MHNQVHAHALLQFRTDLYAAFEPFIDLPTLFWRWAYQRSVVERGAFVLDLEHFCKQLANLPSKAIMIHVVKVMLPIFLQPNL
jgi:hypothetical protein